MAQKHDPSQVGKADTSAFVDRPTTGREDVAAAYAKMEREGEAICAARNAKPGNVARWTSGWAWKGYGFRVDLPARVDAVLPTTDEILATEEPPVDDYPI